MLLGPVQLLDTKTNQKISQTMRKESFRSHPSRNALGEVDELFRREMDGVIADITGGLLKVTAVG